MTNVPEPKANANNTSFLAQVKTAMSGKIYKHVLGLTRTQGRVAAAEYLQQFFNIPLANVTAFAEALKK